MQCHGACDNGCWIVLCDRFGRQLGGNSAIEARCKASVDDVTRHSPSAEDTHAPAKAVSERPKGLFSDVHRTE